MQYAVFAIQHDMPEKQILKEQETACCRHQQLLSTAPVSWWTMRIFSQSSE
jgi:hypothetical protein